MDKSEKGKWVTIEYTATGYPTPVPGTRFVLTSATFVQKYL